jgi:PKD repeat protein
VSNGVTPNTATKTITITTPPGPVANFTVNLSSPTAPSNVSFNNTSTGNPTTWAWDFGDGTTSAVKNPPTKVYAAGTWIVQLKVDNALGTSTTTKTFTIAAPIPMCKVPDFKNQQSDATPSIQSQWQAAGFNTTVIFNPLRPPEYQIKSQSLKKGDDFPCAGTVITVSK